MKDILVWQASTRLPSLLNEEDVIEWQSGRIRGRPKRNIMGCFRTYVKLQEGSEGMKEIWTVVAEDGILMNLEFGLL